MAKLNDKKLIYRELVEYRIEYYCADKKGKDRIEDKVRQYIKGIDEKDFVGWIDLPTKYDKKEFKRIKEAVMAMYGEVGKLGM